MVVTGAWAAAYMRDVMAAVNDRDWVTFERLHHPSVRYISPVTDAVGVQAVCQRHRELAEAAPDFRVKFTTRTVEPWENRAVFENVQTGTHTGDLDTPFGTIKATGKPFEIHGVMVVTFNDDGQVVELRSYFDVMDALRQIGFEP